MADADVIRAEIARRTFLEFGQERLGALCAVAGPSAPWREFRGLFERMLQPWGARPIGDFPLYASNVADDQAPFEFSIAFSDGAPEVQFYVEALAKVPSLASNMAAGRALLENVASDLRAPLDRLSLVKDLFFPTEPHGPFTIWTGVSCAAGGEIQLKAYLNPQVQGSAMTSHVVGEAMSRLGFAAQWAKVNDARSASSERLDEIGIVSMDLSSAAGARVKVYIRHHRATLKDIRTFVSAAAGQSADDAAMFYGALADNEGPFLQRPLITEFTFSDLNLERPTSFTLEFPIGSYVTSDEVACARVAECLRRFDLSPDRYVAAVRAFATRPLDERSGIHAHVTLRRQQRRPRIAIYLASEAYARAAAPE